MLVLTYHSISAGPPPLCVSPERLAEQLDGLTALGWQAVRLAEIEERMASPTGDLEPVFAITFDDGYRDFHTAALAILEARGLPATLFALPPLDSQDSDAVGAGRVSGGVDLPVLSAAQLRTVAGRGIEIGAHSVSHCDLTQLDAANCERELEQGRRSLEEVTDSPVLRLAYPYGRFDRSVCEAARKIFRSAFTTQLAEVTGRTDPLGIPRVDAYYLDSPSLWRALAAGQPERFLTPRRWLRRLRGSEPRRPLPRRVVNAARS
jgi:peptidoglycan/xylan/chitin deacetylase (PgdA/CDA1 family)